LQNNGGPTLTHAPQTGSPAIDAGNPATPGSGGTACEASDQRGYARPVDGDGNGSVRCDIGALEVGSATIVYTYDPLYRLTAANYGNGSVFSYTYDAVGNRLTQTTITNTQGIPISVTWSIPVTDVWQLGETRQSPAISPILQAIVERKDWQTSNALAIISKSVKNDGVDVTPGSHRRVIGWDREQNTDHTARLVVNLIEPPPATTSVYLNTKKREDLYNLGLNYGLAGESGLVILDFGNIRTYGTRYGTRLFGSSGEFASTTDIVTATEGFLDGWWRGYLIQGRLETPNAKITVAIGINNCGNGGISATLDNPCVPGGTYMVPEHGRAWAEMVSSLRDYTYAMHYATRETIAAANDMELSWNYPEVTNGWVYSYTEYISASSSPPFGIPPIKLYDFGSCEGCNYPSPQVTVSNVISNPTTGMTETITWDWQLTEVLTKSWAAPYNYPVPEIYAQSGVHARQWASLSRAAYATLGGPILFPGVLTESQSCADLCDVIGNEPSEGWIQLFDALCSDPTTCVMNIPWSTDIRFR
jgi:YD repeat-containing protein